MKVVQESNSRGRVLPELGSSCRKLLTRSHVGVGRKSPVHGSGHRSCMFYYVGQSIWQVVFRCTTATNQDEAAHLFREITSSVGGEGSGSSVWEAGGEVGIAGDQGWWS